MRLKFPLYGQILFWFFLNLALVVGAIYLVCSVIFGLDMRAMVRDGVRVRMVAIGREVGAALRDSPREKWDDLLVRYGDEHGVTFTLYHSSGDRRLAGEEELPGSLMKFLRDEHIRPMHLSPDEGSRYERPSNENPFDEVGPPRRRGERDKGRPDPRGRHSPPRRAPRGLAREKRSVPGPRMLFLAQTGELERHWAGVWIPLLSSEYRHPIDGALVASSPGLGGNNVFVDWRPWVWAIVAVLGVSSLIWFPFVRSLSRRLRRLTTLAESISEGDFTVAEASQRSDEIGRLSRSIRQMAMKLETFVTGQRRFLGDTAHELCSPLARVRLNLELLEREIPDADNERFKELGSEVEELSQLVNELLAFSKASLKPTALTYEEINVRELVEELVQREASGLSVDCDVSPSIICQSNREFLRRALGNLLKNGVRYAGAAGPIVVRGCVVENSVELMVEDSGSGIPEEWREKVLEPFARPELARTREGGGVGLGLAIAKSCIEAVGGRIELKNGRERGLIATLTFPSGV